MLGFGEEVDERLRHRATQWEDMKGVTVVGSIVVCY